MNESEDDVSEEKDLEIRDVNTNFLDNRLNVKDNAVKMLNSNRLQVNFASKNIVNLSRQNLTDSEISLLSKGLNFVPTSFTIDKAKLKTELEALLKNDKSIFIKGADKESAVVVWDRENYIQEAEKQLGYSDVYEKVPDDPEPLISTIHPTIEKLGKEEI